MKTFIFLTLLVCSSARADSLFVLALGESKKLKAPAGQTIRVSNSKVVRVQDQGSSLLVSGRKVGQSVIGHGQGAFRVEVVDAAVARTYALFIEIMREMMGLQLDVIKNQIVVRGELLRLKDWRELSNAQKQTGGNWLMQARLDPSIRTQAKELVRQVAKNSGRQSEIRLLPYPHLQVPATHAKFFETNAAVKNLGLTVQSESRLLDVQPAIRLNLTLAEVQNGVSERLGLAFADGQSVQLSPVFKAPQDFAATLNFMKEKGWAQVLSTPSLVARSDEEAELLNGGEFAVRSRRKYSEETTWKRHGLWIKFKPRWDARGLVQLQVEAEFSAPDYGNQVNGVPSLRTSKTRSAIDMRVGSTVLLSGLLHENKGWSASGPAGLADIPVIGRLFRSQDFLQSRSRLQIFITPELVPLNIDEPQSQSEEVEWNWEN